jgi:hypothetical protein
LCSPAALPSHASVRTRWHLPARTTDISSCQWQLRRTERGARARPSESAGGWGKRTPDPGCLVVLDPLHHTVPADRSTQRRHRGNQRGHRPLLRTPWPHATAVNLGSTPAQ